MPSITRMSDNTVVVNYRPAEITRDITAAEYEFIRYVYSHIGLKAGAIRFIKDQYDLSLYDAKAIVDMICNPEYNRNA